MSSDSEDDYSYTNSASVLKALRDKDISINSDLEKSKDEINFFDLTDSPIKTRNHVSKELKPKAVETIPKNNNDDTDNCIILSDNDDTDATPVNIISTIDKILQNKSVRGKRAARGRNRNTRAQSKKAKIAATSTITILDDSVSNIETNPDLNDDDINYEMTIKVFWKSQFLERFPLKRFDNLKQIYEHFAKKENLPESRLLFTINDNVISKYDNPKSLNITAATIIEGGVLSATLNINNKNQDKNRIELKVQLKDRKHPLLLSLSPDDKMEVLMYQCSQELDVPINQLKFYFDGELIKSNSKPVDLEFEGGEVIDCIKK